MSDIECVDPQVGSWSLGLYEASAQQDEGEWDWEPCVATGVWVHRYSCPSCQAEYPDAVESISSLTPETEERVRKSN